MSYKTELQSNNADLQAILNAVNYLPDDTVRYTEQTLTPEQQAQARKNIGAVTPQRGVDYWTESDQELIVQQVISALGTPVFGSVDENNNIILSGALPSGSYTVKYENADGSMTDIGTVIISGETDGPNTTLEWEMDVKIDTSTGAETTANYYHASNYIEIVDGYTYTVSKIDTTDINTGFGLKVVYYDENKNFISATASNVIADVKEAVSVELPLNVSGAKYFRIRLYVYDQYFSDDLVSLTASPTTVSPETDGPDTTIEWDIGVKIDTSTGAETEGSSYHASNYIEIVPGYTYTVSKIDTAGFEGGFSLRAVYYDENKNFISATGSDSIGYTEEASSAEIPVDVSGARYFRLRLYVYQQYLSDDLVSLTASPTESSYTN